jgi:hypothetical protein
MRNISLRGMFIDMPQPLWVHAEFKVRLSLPEPIELDCVVKRVEPGRGGGVEFKDLPEAEREQLGLLVAGLAGNDATRKPSERIRDSCRDLSVTAPEPRVDRRNSLLRPRGRSAGLLSHNFLALQRRYWVRTFADCGHRVETRSIGPEP